MPRVFLDLSKLVTCTTSHGTFANAERSARLSLEEHQRHAVSGCGLREPGDLRDLLEYPRAGVGRDQTGGTMRGATLTWPTAAKWRMATGALERTLRDDGWAVSWDMQPSQVHGEWPIGKRPKGRSRRARVPRLRYS